jgi:hypothetical protein
MITGREGKEGNGDDKGLYRNYGAVIDITSLKDE